MDHRLFIEVFMPLRGATLDEVFPLIKTWQGGLQGVLEQRFPESLRSTASCPRYAISIRSSQVGVFRRPPEPPPRAGRASATPPCQGGEMSGRPKRPISSAARSDAAKITIDRLFRHSSAKRGLSCPQFDSGRQGSTSDLRTERESPATLHFLADGGTKMIVDFRSSSGMNLSSMENLFLPGKTATSLHDKVNAGPHPEFFNHTILISPSTCLKSGSPVTSSAFDRLASAAAKQSAYDIRCLDLKLAAA